ncbi:MAG TPA: His-Xaa-Ser system protein HxsD [Nannocystaceae bacterium]|nr:His-Xaa-Ser system protein HxsD [Nannocystaceae bacterium]
MSESLFGMPTPEVEADLGDGMVRLRVDAGVYDLEAIYAAAYTFIARCFVLVDRPAPDRFVVTLSSKQLPVEQDTLRALVGDFANELLASAWRRTITRNNRALIESVTMQAFAGAMGPPSLSELEAFDFSDEPFDDPLGIAQSWEEKYKKRPKDEAP